MAEQISFSYGTCRIPQACALWVFCQLNQTGANPLKAAMQQMQLSARAYHRTQSVKLARTIADLAGSEQIQTAHVAEAIQYRPRARLPCPP